MKSTRNLWPLGIIGAFAVFFVGITTVIVIAATHRESLVNANYYEQELKFQGQIDSADRALKSGATVAYDAAHGRYLVSLPAAHLVKKFSGAIELYRPSAAGLDHEIRLEPKADGTQTLDVSKLAAGPWRLRVNWNAGGEAYFLEQKFSVAGK